MGSNKSQVEIFLKMERDDWTNITFNSSIYNDSEKIYDL